MKKETLWVDLDAETLSRITEAEFAEIFLDLDQDVDPENRPRIISIRTEDGQQIHRKCYGIRIGKGNPEWGAPTDREVFIIKLGPSCWSEEKRIRVRASRRRNRRLREIGEIKAKSPLLWEWEALRQGYAQEEIDNWDGQRKNRKKKPIRRYNNIPVIGLVEMDITSRKLQLKEKIRTGTPIPKHWWDAEHIRFEAHNKSTILLQRMDTGMVHDDAHFFRLIRAFKETFPARSGWQIVAAFEKIIVTSKVWDRFRPKPEIIPMKTMSDYAE